MSEIPSRLKSSGLWSKLSLEKGLQHDIERLRAVVETLASKISEQLPEFTDHSIKHLDALWWTADQIVTADEMSKITPGEAFVLAGALYLHDLGMAAGATEQGAAELRTSDIYRSTLSRLCNTGVKEDEAKIISLRNAARVLHANLAMKLAVDLVPGLNRYLIEDSDTRSHWGTHIGQVAASHHWSIPEVNRVLGSRGKVPDVLGQTIDLGYVACLLRIVDYAHINMDRASTIERLLRPHMPADSVKHWSAQEHITGPTRESTQLVYGTTKAIESVDGWWTFYEMVKGLDMEITSVGEYLNARSISNLRFTLDGVKSAKTPQSFATLVPTQNFEPVDIRFRPNSMERLVSILGGRTLYGNDHYAAVRELLQNARDAITLRQRDIVQDPKSPDDGEIRLALEQIDDKWHLSVSDDGVGMSASVVTNYLLGIAADYWSSAEFYAEHTEIARKAFRPVGRFGIGFLSVFMLGDSVEVYTQRRGGPNLLLKLHGVGQRGALLSRSPSSTYGTTVRVHIPKEKASNYEELGPVVLAKAPMLSIPIKVSTPTGTTAIVPGWWKTANQEELSLFLARQQITSTTPKHLIGKEVGGTRYFYSGGRGAHLAKIGRYEKWPGSQPELLGANYRILAVPHMGSVLVCSKGFAVDMAHVEGMMGVVDMGNLELNAARSHALGWDAEAFRNRWLDELRPHLISALDVLAAEGDIPARFEFLLNVAKTYGHELLLDTKLPWITLRESPGNARLISVQEFTALAQSASEVFILYGATPWNAESLARTIFPQAPKDALFIPVSMVGQPEPGSYDDEDETFENPLEEHFVGKRSYERGNIKDAVLLTTTLAALERAYGASAVSQGQWIRFKRRIAGRFVRPTKLPEKTAK